MSRDGRRLLLLVAGSTVAFAMADGIYRRAIVPRLPGWQSVPWGWWLLYFAPMALAVVAAGLLCTSTIRIPIYTLALIIPPTLIQAARGVLTGEPVGHDMWVGDPGYWVILTFRVLLCMVLVALIYFWAFTVRVRHHGA